MELNDGISPFDASARANGEIPSFNEYCHLFSDQSLFSVCSSAHSFIFLSSLMLCFLFFSLECDDGNQRDLDGCSATCQEEYGWICDGTLCVTTCGDNVVGAPNEGSY